MAKVDDSSQYPGQQYSGQPYPGQQPQATQPYPGQPVPGQAVPGQPYPGQPVPGGAPPRQPRSKLRIVFTLVGVFAVCAGLCGIGQLITNLVNKDEWEGLGQPVPATTLTATPTPTWKPPNMFGPNPQPAAQIRHDLEGWVLQSAGVAKPTTSNCDQPGFTGQIATTLTCTVTYEGQQVVYTVTTRPKGNYVFEWDSKSTHNVVTRDGLLAYVHRQFAQGRRPYDNLRCEEFPAVALAPVGQFLSQFCYGKDGSSKTVKIKIKVSGKGAPHFETERQD